MVSAAPAGFSAAVPWFLIRHCVDRIVGVESRELHEQHYMETESESKICSLAEGYQISF